MTQETQEPRLPRASGARLPPGQEWKANKSAWAIKTVGELYDRVPKTEQEKQLIERLISELKAGTLTFSVPMTVDELLKLESQGREFE